MTIQERIIQVIENKNITPYRFCKDLGLSMGYLDKRGAIGTDKYLKIIEYLSEINPIWLLTGKGEMLKEPTQSAVLFSQPEENDKYTALLEKQVAQLEKINTLQEDKIAYLEYRLALAEVKDKEEMSLKIKKQRKEHKELSAQKDSIINQQKEVINLQNEEINALKSRHLTPDEPLQPTQRV